MHQTFKSLDCTTSCSMQARDIMLDNSACNQFQMLWAAPNSDKHTRMAQTACPVLVSADCWCSAWVCRFLKMHNNQTEEEGVSELN